MRTSDGILRSNSRCIKKKRGWGVAYLDGEEKKRSVVMVVMMVPSCYVVGWL